MARMRTWAVVGILGALLSMLAPTAAAATSTGAPTASLRVSTTRVAAGGGSIVLTAAVHGATTCRFFSAPDVPGIAGAVPCSGGSATRHGSVPRSREYRTIDLAVVASGSGGITEQQVTIDQGTLAPPPDSTKTVMKLIESGSATTRLFGIPPGSIWSIGWAYECSNGINGFQFDVYKYPADLPDLNDTGPLDLNAKGSGQQVYQDAGTFYLQVITDCPWAVTVSYLPPSRPQSLPVVPSLLVSSLTPQVPQSGGVVTLKAKVQDAAMCTYITVPPIPKLDGTAPCIRGAYLRAGRLSATASPRPVYAEVVVTSAAGLTTAGVQLEQRSPHTLLSDSGPGSQLLTSVNTPLFTIPPSDPRWTLVTRYVCPSAASGGGGVLIFVNNSLSGDSINLSPSGSGSRTSTFTDTGKFSLNISTDCRWSVTVVG
jgi:hypothetical protein